MSLSKKLWSILLCLILAVSLNSCQKDLLTDVNPEIISETPPGVSTISFEELQKRIKITKSGIYNSVLADANANDGKFQLKEDIILLTNKITMISRNGMTTYTLAVQQKSGQRATFQNVIFVDRKGIVETHLLTYKASKSFASRLKVDKNAAFEGYVSYSILGNKKQKGTMSTVSAETCNEYTFEYSVPYQCAYALKHWPWQEDECEGKNTSNGPGYDTGTKTVRICERTGDGTGTWVTTTIASTGGGGSGGSVTTYPTLPLNYQPNCEYGYSGVSQVKSLGMSTSSVGDGDCAYEDPNPAGLIANINKLTGHLGLSWAEQEFLYEMDALQGKTVSLDLISYLDQDLSNLPYSSMLAKKHVELMFADIDYRTFAFNTYIPSAPGKQWFDDTDWLNNPTNITTANALNLFEKIGQQGTSTDYDVSGDEGSYTTTGYDQTTYPAHNPTEPFPTVLNVIASDQYRGFKWDGRTTNCMTLAKQQLALAGYQQSGPTAGQYWITYTEPSTVHATNAAAAVNYMLYALQAGIPVIAGVDHNLNKGINEGTTDHFIVIVGCGNDANGKYFRYYDNATGNKPLGAHTENKLHYNTTTGAITAINGTKAPSAAQNSWDNYKLSQVRRSKIL